MGFSTFLGRVLHGFTKSVFEAVGPQLTGDNVGFNPLDQTETQWARNTFNDEFIYQEFSTFPDRESHGSETAWSHQVTAVNAVNYVSDPIESPVQGEGATEYSMEWKTRRPTFLETLKQGFRWGSVLSLFMGTVFGSLCMMYSFISMYSSDMCWWLSWKEIPRDVQWYIQACVYIKLFLYHSSCFASILLIFKSFQLEGLRKKLFFVLCLTSLLDIAYKVVLQLLSAIKKSVPVWIPGNVLLVMGMAIQARIVSGNLRYDARGKLVLALQFIIPWILGRCAQYAFIYLVYPWYIEGGRYARFLIAAGAPICVVISKAISRTCVQRLWGINHPGTSFIFLAPLYHASAIFTRMLQAELADLGQIAALATIHGLVEVVERSTMALRDHIYNQIIERRFAPCGTFRTPRSERLHADITIMSMLQESMCIVAVNGFVFVLRMVYSPTADYPQIVTTWLIKTALQLGIEWIFICISFAIATHFQNMPIRKVWKSKWHLHVAITFILASTIFFATTGYFYNLMHTSFILPSKQRCSIPFI